MRAARKVWRRDLGRRFYRGTPPIDRTYSRVQARLQTLTLVLLIVGGLSGVLHFAEPASIGQAAQPDPTATPFPLYLPHLSRALGGTPPPRPTSTLPPPITPEPISGYVCRRPGDAGICWASARFSLARGPGPACGPDMTTVYFLVANAISLELYEGSYVQLRGETDDSPGCPPLLRVAVLEVPATPTPAP